MTATLSTLAARSRTMELLDDAARRRTGRPLGPSAPRLRVWPLQSRRQA